MTVGNEQIADAAGRYLAWHPDERPNLGSLLCALDSGADLASRTTVPVHVTCSAVVIDDRSCVLMIRHKALNRWLLPGGHLEPVDADLVAAALRELNEETGISRQQVLTPPGIGAVPVDIDLHRIPVNPGNGEPEHWHADFRYTCRVGTADVRLQSDEATDYGWHPVAYLPTSRLITKIKFATRP